MDFAFGLGSDIGKKKHSNQDKLLIKIGEAPHIGEFGLFVVADGMGGMAEGEVASEMAVNSLKYWWERLTVEDIIAFNPPETSQRLAWLFQTINHKIREYGYAKGIRLGTTLSALFVARQRFVLCHIGDSRIYRLNPNGKELVQLTMDHTYVAEQARMGLIDQEDVSMHPYRNVLTQCLGVSSEISPFTAFGIVQAHEVFLLCSDGLYNKVASNELASIISDHLESGSDPAITANLLIEIANDKGGNDNISTIILWDRSMVNNKGAVLNKLRNLLRPIKLTE